jgi:hypothetical protein
MNDENLTKQDEEYIDAMFNFDDIHLDEGEDFSSLNEEDLPFGTSNNSFDEDAPDDDCDDYKDEDSYGYICDEFGHWSCG